MDEEQMAREKQIDKSVFHECLPVLAKAVEANKKGLERYAVLDSPTLTIMNRLVLYSLPAMTCSQGQTRGSRRKQR